MRETIQEGVQCAQRGQAFSLFNLMERRSESECRRGSRQVASNGRSLIVKIAIRSEYVKLGQLDNGRWNPRPPDTTSGLSRSEPLLTMPLLLPCGIEWALSDASI